MHKNGHAGVSALLTAPFVAAFLIFDLVLIAGIFGVVSLILSSFPDIDLKISSLNHRGFTHTIQFAVIVGVFFGVLFLGGLVALNYYAPSIYSNLYNMIMYPIWVIPLTAGVGGFSGILFHMLGDIPTPQGIHFFSRENNYGLSLNLFNANNKSANKYINTFGFLILGGSILVGINPTQDFLLGFAGLFIFVIVSWIIISTTRLGKLFY